MKSELLASGPLRKGAQLQRAVWRVAGGRATRNAYQEVVGAHTHTHASMYLYMYRCLFAYLRSKRVGAAKRGNSRRQGRQDTRPAFVLVAFAVGRLPLAVCRLLWL